MAVQMLPTGYEDDQRKAAHRRKLADLMMQKGLTENPNMSNWLQVIGQMGHTFAGKRMGDKADKMDSDISDRMLEDYTKSSTAFAEDEKTLPVDDLVKKYRGHKFMNTHLKPYEAAMVAGLKERGELVYGPNGWGPKGKIPLGSRPPMKATDATYFDAEGNVHENTAVTESALRRQGYGQGEDPAMMPNPMPVPAPQPAPQAMPDPMAAPMPQPGVPAAGGPPIDPALLAKLTPQELEVMISHLKTRAGGGAEGSTYTQPNANVPMGNPLTAVRAPAGVVNGKPYWIIDGKISETPEGQ